MKALCSMKYAEKKLFERAAQNYHLAYKCLKCCYSETELLKMTENVVFFLNARILRGKNGKYG